MARLDLSGLDEFQDWIDSKGEIPETVVGAMLIAEGDVVADRQKTEAEAMLQGPYYKGAVTAGVKRFPPVMAKSAPYVKVAFQGTQHGESVGTIAFINEYGKTNQPPRPFVWEANKKCEAEAVAAAAAIFHDFMEE